MASANTPHIADADDPEREYLRHLLSGLNGSRSDANKSVGSASALDASKLTADLNESGSVAAAATLVAAADVSGVSGVSGVSSRGDRAASLMDLDNGRGGAELSRVLAAWIDEASVTTSTTTTPAGAAGAAVGRDAAARDSDFYRHQQHHHHHQQQQQQPPNNSASGPPSPVRPRGSQRGGSSSLHYTQRPPSVLDLLAPEGGSGGGWSVSAASAPYGHGAGSRAARSLDLDSPASASGGGGGGGGGGGSWSRKQGGGSGGGHHHAHSGNTSTSGGPVSRDPMLAPAAPSASQPFVPPATTSMLRTAAEAAAASSLAALPSNMPPISLFAPFQATSHAVAVMNLEAKTTQRQLFQIFFPLGASDAVVFAAGAVGHRKSGVVLFASADAAVMAAEKIDNFVPHGQSQPLTCVFLPKGEQVRMQQLQQQQQQQRQPDSSRRSSANDSTASSGCDDAAPLSDHEGGSYINGNNSKQQQQQQQQQQPQPGYGSFQVSSSTTPRTPNDSGLRGANIGTPPPSQPLRSRGAMHRHTATSPPPTPSRDGGYLDDPQPPLPQRELPSLMPSARPTPHAHTISTLLNTRRSIGEVYPLLMSSVIGQPPAAVTSVVDATVSAICSLLRSPEQQRSALKSVASLIKRIAEDPDPAMRRAFQEPISRCVVQLMLDPAEDPSSRSVSAVACGYLFDHAFITGNPYPMCRKLMLSRAHGDPHLVDALITLTSSWSSRNAASRSAPGSADDAAAEAEFRQLVRQFYDAEGHAQGMAGLGQHAAAADVSSLNSTGSTEAAGADAPRPSAKPVPHGMVMSTTIASSTSTAGSGGNCDAAAATAGSVQPAAALSCSTGSCSSIGGGGGGAIVRETTLQRDLLQSTVYITRIPPGVRDDKLRRLFIEYGGEFNKVRIYDDNSSSSAIAAGVGHAVGRDAASAARGRGAFCFVEFVEPRAARALIRNLNGFAVGESALLVSYARSAIHDQDPRDAVFTAERGKVRECLFGVTAAAAAAAVALPSASSSGGGPSTPPLTHQYPPLPSTRPQATVRPSGAFPQQQQQLNASASAFTPGVGWTRSSGPDESRADRHRDPRWEF